MVEHSQHSGPKNSVLLGFDFVAGILLPVLDIEPESANFRESKCVAFLNGVLSFAAE
jgi:hypothetical protein